MTEPQDQSVVDTAADPAAQTPGTDTGAGNASAQSAGVEMESVASAGNLVANACQSSMCCRWLRAP